MNIMLLCVLTNYKLLATIEIVPSKNRSRFEQFQLVILLMILVSGWMSCVCVRSVVNRWTSGGLRHLVVTCVLYVAIGRYIFVAVQVVDRYVVYTEGVCPGAYRVCVRVASSPSQPRHTPFVYQVDHAAATGFIKSSLLGSDYTCFLATGFFVLLGKFIHSQALDSI